MAHIDMNSENEPLLMALMRVVACPPDKRNEGAEQTIIDAMQELITVRLRIKALEGIVAAQSAQIDAQVQRNAKVYEVIAALAHYGIGGLMPVEYVLQARELLRSEQTA